MSATRRIFLLLGGVTWLIFALLGVLLIFRYLQDGAGLQLFGQAAAVPLTIPLSSLHVVGLLAGTFFSFALGVCWLAFGVAGAEESSDLR